MRKALTAPVYAVAIVLLATGTAPSQDRQELERGLQAQYVGKYWLIRGFYEGADLRFDGTGKLVKGKAQQPWTVAGVEIVSLKLHDNEVEIDANRVAYVYDSAKRKFTRTYRVVQRNRKQETEKLKIRLETPSSADEAGLRQILDNVLIADNKPVLSEVPEYWRDFLANTDKEEDARFAAFADTGEVYRIGGGVKAPRPASTPDPKYTDPARLARFQGTVILAMVIDRTGHPKEVIVLRPLGFGLDDMAVAAVNGWRFKPAERDGNPIAVRMRVEISFRLY